MANKNILIVPGDGIGQEVTAVGKKVLDKIAAKFGHQFTYDEALIGHVAIEATGNPLPDESLEKMRKSDAVLFGAVGHPKYDNDPGAKVRPEQGLQTAHPDQQEPQPQTRPQGDRRGLPGRPGQPQEDAAELKPRCAVRAAHCAQRQA